MLRGIAGAIVGYIVIAVVVFGGLTVGYLALGADGSFTEGSYDVSATWIAVWLVVSFVAAMIGGLVCRLISANMTAPMVLAAIVLVLGIAMALPQVMTEREDPGPRTGDVGNLEAMNNAQAPPWVAFANPFVGAIGVLAGAKLRGRSTSAVPNRLASDSG